MSQSNSYTKAEIYVVLILAFFGFMFDGYDLLIYPYVLHFMSIDLNLSYMNLAIAGSLSLVGTLLGAFVFGIVSDVWGRKKGLMCTIGLYGVATLLTAFSQNIVEIAILRFIAGLGIGGEWGIGFALLNEVWKDKRRGVAGGILQSSFSLGAVLAIFVAMLSVTYYPVSIGWRVVYISGGIPAIMVAIIRFYVPESKVWLNRTSLKKDKEIYAVFTNFLNQKTLYNFTFSLVLTFGTFFMAYSIIFWWPSTLIKVYHISPFVYTYPLIVGSLIQIPIMWAIGAFSDKSGRKITALIFVSLTIIALIYWYYNIVTYKTFSGNIWYWPVMLGFLFFSGTSLFMGVFGTWFGEMFDTKIRATAPNIAYMFGRGIGGGLAVSFVILYATQFGGVPSSMIFFALIGTFISLIAIMALPSTKDLKL